MNKLPEKDRARILHLLCEGSSIRAVTRLTGASKKAVSRLLVDAGQGRLLVSGPRFPQSHLQAHNRSMKSGHSFIANKRTSRRQRRPRRMR